MVWGGISRDYRCRLVLLNISVNSERYIDRVLEPEVLRFFEEFPDVLLLQHDNASCHSARRTQEFLSSNGIFTLPWPALSPDLNPIEHVWDGMKRRIQSRKPENLIDLARGILDAWKQFPQETIKNLEDSMPRRIEAVIRFRGGHSGY